jgi:hypothetical protein
MNTIRKIIEECSGLKSLVVAAALLSATSGMAQAQAVPVPFEIEGPITNVDAGLRTIEVMGITINVPQRTPRIPIVSPTATVTLAQINGARMPGRLERGFIGGTAIIVGSVLADGSYEAQDVFVEPAENVLRGPLSCTSPLRIGGLAGCSDGIELRPLTDVRMPAGAIKNQFGFEINAATLTPGTFSAVEGYYSEIDRVIHFHTLEVDGNAQLAVQGHQVSVQRADCRIRGGSRDEIEIRGGVTNGTRTLLAANTQVSVTLAQRNGRSRTIAVPVITSLDAPGFGSYTLRATNLNYPVGGCPATVTVRSQQLGTVLATSPAAPVSSR